MLRSVSVSFFPLIIVCCAGATPVGPATPGSVAPKATMVHFDGGEFQMGSASGDAEERPRHAVTVAPFDMDTFEVTVAAYGECVRAGSCSAAPDTVEWEGILDSDRTVWSKYCNGARADRQAHPVNCVDWNQATAYCKWAGKRLPTEAEWEFAARGKEGRNYPWGEDAPNETRVNACASECVAMAKEEGFTWSGMFPASDQWAATSPVGTYPAGKTPEGLMDMAGNVWEWTSTKYSRYDGSNASDGLMMRGGCWDSYMSRSLRGANRVSGGVTERRNTVGFRCAKDPA